MTVPRAQKFPVAGLRFRLATLSELQAAGPLLGVRRRQKVRQGHFDPVTETAKAAHDLY